MANAAKKSGVTQTIIEANVAEDGTVTLKGTISKRCGQSDCPSQF